MGIYIDGIEINGTDKALIFPTGEVYVFRRDIDHDVWLKAVNVEDYGRLISADALKDTLSYYILEAGWGDETNNVLRWVRDEVIDSEHTIIPADKEET